MTPAQIETSARRRYNSESSTFWSQDEVFKTIWEAECILAREGLVIESTSTTTTVAGTQSYAFPTDASAMKRITYNGNKLKPINMREDDALTLNNQATTAQGTPTYYFEWNRTVYLRPIPDSALTLKYWFYAEPTLLTTASTTLDVPSDFHQYLIDYVCSIMAAKDENLRMASWYEAKWLDGVMKAKSWSRRRRSTDQFGNVQDEAALAETILGSV